MADKHVILQGSSFTYAVSEKLKAELDLEKVFGFSKLGELAQKAILFATKTMLRNATAGRMDKPEDALKAVKTRVEALMAGKWQAHREGGERGESEHSQLARALALVQGCEPADAAAFIAQLINEALEENGIDPDSDSETLTDEEKAKQKKIVRETKKGISEDPGVAVQLAKIRADEAAKKAAEAVKAAEGQKSSFAK
jgi:hypothetical protein